LPQWHWLVNLSRFIDRDCELRFHRFDRFVDVVDINSRADVVPPDDSLIDEILKESDQLELWFYLDQILWDLSGTSMTWKQLLDHYQTRHAECYRLVTTRFRSLANVLS
jgi:hypothetical protein